MSLVKTDNNGRIRLSWAEKKSTKRLEKILYKLELNRLKLEKVSFVLQQYNLKYNDILLLRNKYLLLESELRAIIIRRDSKVLNNLKDE